MENTNTPGDLVDRIFAGQRDRAWALRRETATQRVLKLKRLADALLAHRAALYEAFAQDFRKPPAEVESTELLPVVEEVRHAVKALHRWMAPTRVSATWPTLGTRSRIEYQPRGRCLILGPWNYPVNTVLCPLVSAVAAGNTVIIKPSELTPAISRVLEQLVASVFDEREVAVVQGGVERAQQLLSLPFDHVFFTGSTTVGKAVMKAAADHLASVTLELGGRSPVIVDESADLKRAAELVMWGKLINAGQSCVAPDHVFVHRSVRARFVQACVDVVHRRFGEGAEAHRCNEDLARIISVRHAGRLEHLLRQAITAGGQVALGAQAEPTQCYVAPTILTDLPVDAEILQQEIFGPILPVMDYDSLDDVLSSINAGHKPLALYVWSERSEVVRHIIRNTSSGGVCVNHCMLHYVHGHLPFGGINHSGIGNTHGYFGFRAFSHERAVLEAGWVTWVRMMFPPYSRARTRLTRGLTNVLRHL